MIRKDIQGFVFGFPKWIPLQLENIVARFKKQTNTTLDKEHVNQLNEKA